MFEELRKLYSTGATFDVAFRKERLRRLAACLEAERGALESALKADLGKSAEEAWLTEIGFVEREIAHALRHIDRWMRDKSVRTPLFMFPGKSRLVAQPRGLVLIISPWNYPIQLSLSPLVAALSAGNVAVVKPSEFAPATSHWLAEHLPKVTGSDVVAVVEGGVPETTEILAQKFDFIFFTGSTRTAKVIAHAAAEHLTPVSLELGGKSPCVVDATAKLDLAAKRLAFGKLLNCGQTCVAPDYLLIDRRVKDEFIALLKKHITTMAGENALANAQYVHMINRKHYDRVMGLIDPAKVVLGGQGDPETLRIQPTIMDGVTADDAIMQEEIFGPVLPVMSYDSLDEAIDFIRSREHPLALYLFSEDKRTQERFLKSVPFGGGCINDTIIHLATSRMGFGGVGNSGMGSYHGRKSFDTFSHEKSIVDKSTWMDLPVRYMPYSPIKDKLLRMFLR